MPVSPAADTPPSATAPLLGGVPPAYEKLHRTFRWAKHLELSLGGGTAHLRRLGALLAAG